MSGIQDYEIIDQILDKFKDEAKESLREQTSKRKAEAVVNSLKEELEQKQNVINNYRAKAEKLDRIDFGISKVFSGAREEGKDYSLMDFHLKEIQKIIKE